GLDTGRGHERSGGCLARTHIPSDGRNQVSIVAERRLDRRSTYVVEADREHELEIEAIGVLENENRDRRTGHRAGKRQQATERIVDRAAPCQGSGDFAEKPRRTRGPGCGFVGHPRSSTDGRFRGEQSTASEPRNDVETRESTPI